MQILLISECSKQALTETRRILDQFACRLGQRTWQTSITQEGLNTLRMLLRRTARKNTAVACHWVKQGGQSELLWIVGNLRCFDEHGRVPTDTSHRNILRSRDENDWSSAESLALMAAIAGLFHDFGKANRMFQQKLLPGAGLKTEPVRHEWVSLCLFAAFVDQQADSAWLQRLAAIQPADEAGLLAKFASRKAQTGWVSGAAPLAQLRGLARVVGWLIVTHHRLPAIPSSEKMCVPEQAMIGDGVQPSRFHAGWNSPQLIVRTDWREQDHRDVWSFDAGTPCSSARWCDKARQIGRRALQHSSLMAVDWLEQDAFTCHLARLALMLADHSYSAGPATPKWQDPDYAAWANTASTKDGGPQVRKQKLDEHNAGVAHNALLLARKLPLLRRDLPAISRHRLLKKRTTQAEFQWQNRAYDLAAGVAAISRSQGFFGVNMASTGKGKTFANARIMYGLADERVGCRFSVALGLRTLTLQTGDALRSRLQLEPDELAVLIGSQAVLDLHHSNHDRRQVAAEPMAPLPVGGSESSAELVDDGQHVFFAGSLNEGPIRRWLASDRENKASTLISAPVLVCTIDHLIGATESGRGGRQIAPMLRLLTADLVLDEPDDFDLADLPALCRLVNWAGMLGSRVLLSSATLPPALVVALFEAYAAGRRAYARTHSDTDQTGTVCCAWFDEFGAVAAGVAEREAFKSRHDEFVVARLAALTKAETGLSVLRRGELLPVGSGGLGVFQAITEAIAPAIWQLHRQHHQRNSESDKTVSIGLVRIANIQPLVAVSQLLLQLAPPTDCRLHFCIYHSQHPLLVRSKMEERLDAALKRDKNQPQQLWDVAEIAAALATYPEQHHAFVVLASPVCEVGRDHDYDWAIAEPSSIRSLIQLAGRIQRHRQHAPDSANLLILSRNIRALQGKRPAYCRPGFETAELALASHDMADVLPPEHYQKVNAAPRIARPPKLKHTQRLADLEHLQTELLLFGSRTAARHYNDQCARLWWKRGIALSWCFVFQRLTPFRHNDAGPETRLALIQEDAASTPVFHSWDEDAGEWKQEEKTGSRFDRSFSFKPVDRVSPWFNNDAAALIAELAERLDKDVAVVSRRYTELTISLGRAGNRWRYHPWFGVFQALD